MYQYRIIDVGYFRTAPILLDVQARIDCPVDRLWAIFEDNRAWEAFTPDIERARWTSPRPVCVGSTRNVQLSDRLGRHVVNEVFFDWQPNRHFAFYVKESTSEILGAYGELWSLEDMGGNRTRLRLQTAFEFRRKHIEWFVRRGRPLLNWGFSRHLKSIKSYVDTHVS